jgi:L-threonylcarbamoyladenylate synthase
VRREALAIPFWSPEEVYSATRLALAHMEMRRVLAYPTETVYGFGGAIDRDSVDALVEMKRRPPGKPFLLLFAGSDMIERLDLHLPSYAGNLAARHWPGPLTLVLPVRGQPRGAALARSADTRLAWRGEASARASEGP